VAFIIKKAVGITQDKSEDYIATIGAIGVKGAYNNLQALISAKPDGDIGIYVTTDTGHWFFWNGTDWQDGGQFQAAGLSEEVEQQIGDLSGGFFKDHLIKNGNFSSGKVTPAFGVGLPAANLNIINFNNRNWLNISSSNNVSNGGAGWKLPVSDLSFPLHFEGDIGTNDTTELDFYLIGTDAQGNQINNNSKQLLYSINNEQHAISHVAFDFNRSPDLANASGLELRIQIPGTTIIHGINITGIRLYSLYSHNKEYNDNFLAHTISEANMNGFVVSGAGTPVKEILNINNKNWLAISSDSAKYNGLEITGIPNPNVSLKTDCPIHFETNIWYQNNNLSLTVYLVGTQNDGTQFVQVIKTIPLIANKITQLTADIQIAPELRNSSDLRIRIQCEDEIALQKLKFSDFVLQFMGVTSDVYNGNLLQQNKLSNLPLAWDSDGNGDSPSIRARNYQNQQWVQALANGVIFKSTAINPNNTFYFESDLLSPNQTKLNIYVMGLDDNGAEIGTSTDAILIKTIGIHPKVIDHVTCTFSLSSTMQSAKYVSLRIQDADEKAINLLLTNSKLTYDNPVTKSKNLLPQGEHSQNSLLQARAISRSKYVLSTTYLNGEEWLQLDCTDAKSWQGISWDVDSNVDITRELELHLDLTAGNPKDLQIIVTPYDTMGVIADLRSQVIKEVHLSGNNSIYHIDQRFTLTDTFKTASSFSVKIQQPANDSLNILVKDVQLWYAADNDDNTSDNPEDYYNLPIIKINGELAGINKDNAKQVTYEYRNGNTVLTGFAKLKWQGNSTLLWNKKGYRLQPFTDNTFTTKEKVQFIPSWSPTSKINLKAYYTDGHLSRDIVNANIGADIASTNLLLPNDLKQEDNFGFIDGFPIVLIFNGEFGGIYSFNTARSDFGYTKYGIMGNGYTNVTNFTSTNKTDVKLDGSDFESLNPETATDDEKSAVGDLVTWVATSSDENFKADFEKHLDLKTTMDYFILCNLLASDDSFGKNQIFLTWDGVKWFMQAYDLDTTFGISWDGKAQDLPTGLIGTNNNLFKRLAQLFNSEISARYTELRAWLTPAYMLDKYKKRVKEIGVGNYKLEFAKWNNPSKDIATYKQLKDAVLHQFNLLDSLWLK